MPSFNLKFYTVSAIIGLFLMLLLVRACNNRPDRFGKWRDQRWQRQNENREFRDQKKERNQDEKRKRWFAR